MTDHIKTRDALISYLKRERLAFGIRWGAIVYPYFAGSPYPSYPLSMELKKDRLWQIIANDYQSSSVVFETESEAEAVEWMLKYVAGWRVTEEDSAAGHARWLEYCEQELARQERLQRGIYQMKQLPDGTLVPID